MSDQQPISRSQTAYPYNRPPPQHPPYGPGNGPPLPPPPPHARMHHHAYTDSALIAGASGPSTAAGYPVSANPAYQTLSYNQAPYSNGVSANPPPQYGGPPLQPPPGPVHSRSDGAVPTFSGAQPPPSPYWMGSFQPVGPEKMGGAVSYPPPPGAQLARNPSSPTASSPRQSFGSYQDFASRQPPLPPLPQNEFTAPVGPQSGAPPYGYNLVPPAPPPLPPKVMLPTPPAVPQPDPMYLNGEQQQFQQPIQSSPTSMTQELTPNGNLQPGDDELDRVLRMSMESYAAENQRHAPVAEDEEARILRESREEYEREQERNRMLMSANEESEEEMMARVIAMSLAEEVNKQKQIERQIQRSSRDNMPGPSGSSSRPSFDHESELPYRTSGLTHSASTGSNSSAGRPHTPRPHIVTSLSTPLGSRSATPNPSQMQRSSQSPTHTQLPNPRSPTSPSSPNSMDMLPQYEEVASSPRRPNGQPHLSPIPTTPGLTSSPSSVPQSIMLESPGLQLPHSMSEPTMSPIGLSPGSQVPPSLPPHQMAQGLQGSPPHHRNRPHSSTLPAITTSGGLHRGSSSPSTGAILNQQAHHQPAPGAPGLRTSRSSAQLAPNRPHTAPGAGQGDGFNAPPVPPMPTVLMPVPSIPNGPAGPGPAGANPDLRGRLSPHPPAAGPPPINMNGAGPSTSPGSKRIQMEPEYSNKVSFGYMSPPLDQPVIPPCPAFPETVVIQADAAFHIAAPTWHHLMKLLARLGEAKVMPSPAAFSTMPLSTTVADLRLILHFHKSKVGGEWRVVLWMDYDRALPRSMTPNERGRWTTGDTTLLPWGCRIPEDSISGGLRGPGPMEVSTSSGNVVYVLQAPFPKLPISLSNVATILQEAYQKSKQSSSTGVASSSESSAPQVDKGLSLKRLSKAVDKIYPPSKHSSSVASGVLKRPESSDLVAVGGKRSVGEWFKSGFGRVVGTKEEKGGQWKNEEELADLVTPFSLDGR
ncbi:hypothetical protein M407DRAFT_209716 [Tulasnella calospora MUT 4182]|uniref:Uncharacterized protein n=1 Tax=Tulasnella calospora MUT 4182 TaxID=1051891 RepID=A0A0C3QYV0_9AGAM|nr:hypothetical protein M407DRAFT_209716 [Tulasnella calospora MUT 4182]